MSCDVVRVSLPIHLLRPLSTPRPLFQVFPRISDIREVSCKVAVAVATAAQEDGLARSWPQDRDWYVASFFVYSICCMTLQRGHELIFSRPLHRMQEPIHPGSHVEARICAHHSPPGIINKTFPGPPCCLVPGHRAGDSALLPAPRLPSCTAQEPAASPNQPPKRNIRH